MSEEVRRTHPLPAFHLRSLQSFRDAIKKSRTILNITGAIVSYWKHGGINLEKLGADDLMPAFMYSLVKANVPNLYSELQFLNEFVVEKNFSSDQFNHYLMTRKRMSDLEAALHFINSIDMNVRDEKNALVPVTTMVDRVLNILQVGVAEYLERKVVLVPVHACLLREHMSFHSPAIPLTLFLMHRHRYPTPCGYPNFSSESATVARNCLGKTFRCGRATTAAC